jgi:PDZ domain
MGSKKMALSGPRKVFGLLSVSFLATQSFAFQSPAGAQDIQLMPQQATMDSTPLPAAPKRSMLNGQVSAEEAAANGGDELNDGGKVSIKIQSAGGGPVTLSGAQLRAITDAIRNILPDSNDLQSSTPQFAGRQLKARTADDFRALQYGVIGMVSTKFDVAQPIVDRVFPTCPAALAGIQPGDAVVQANGHVFTKGDGPREYWQRIGGKAGTPIDVTVLRDGQLITFHMKRMNIEDIENTQVRNRYERVLGLFGAPSGEGVQISHAPNRISRPSVKQDDDADQTNDVEEKPIPFQ